MKRQKAHWNLHTFEKAELSLVACDAKLKHALRPPKLLTGRWVDSEGGKDSIVRKRRLGVREHVYNVLQSRKCAVLSPSVRVTSPQPSPEGEGFSIAKAMVALKNLKSKLNEREGEISFDLGT